MARCDSRCLDGRGRPGRDLFDRAGTERAREHTAVDARARTCRAGAAEPIRSGWRGGASCSAGTHTRGHIRLRYLGHSVCARAGAYDERRAGRSVRPATALRHTACRAALDGDDRGDRCSGGRVAIRVAFTPTGIAGPGCSGSNGRAGHFALGAYPSAPRAGQPPRSARGNGRHRIRRSACRNAERDGRTCRGACAGAGCRHVELQRGFEHGGFGCISRHCGCRRRVPYRATGQCRERGSALVHVRGHLLGLCGRDDERAERFAPRPFACRGRPAYRCPAGAALCRGCGSKPPCDHDRVGRGGGT